jgi:hypothetical protein
MSQGHRFFLAIKLFFCALAIWWLHSIPTPTKAGIIIAVVAVVMSLQGEMRPWQKAAWFLLIAAFVAIEFRSIDKDRADYESEQANVRTTEANNFNAIAEGIKRAIHESQAQFKATMESSDRVMGLQVDALNRLSTNLNTLTGDDSYCYLKFTPGQGYLPFLQVGQFPLYEVLARIVDLDTSGKASLEHVMGFTVSLGDIVQHHAVIRPLPTGMVITPNYFNANIFFSARNGDWVEMLREQRIRDRWIRAIRITAEFTALKKDKVVCETIDQDFPRQSNGNIDDGFPSRSGPKLPGCW